MQETIQKYFKRSPGQTQIPASSPLTSVDLALRGNKMLSVTTESVNLDQKINWKILSFLFASAWLCGSASKWALET